GRGPVRKGRGRRRGERTSGRLVGLAVAADGRRAAVAAGHARDRGAGMELIVAIAIGVLTGSGVWLVLRPRSFQVPSGRSLLSYAVHLLILSLGRLYVDMAPVATGAGPVDPSNYSEPLPQALVLTAIVINFAMTALFLVVLLGSRGLSGTDHVDG